MPSLIPAAIGWAVTVWIALLVAGRALLFRDTLVDRLVNRLFAWSVAGLLLYRLAAATAAPSPLTDLALGCVVTATAYLNVLGGVRRGDIDSEALRRREYRCLAAALPAMVTILIAGAGAREAGRALEIGRTWDGILLAIAFGVPIMINTAAFVRMVGSEYRRGDLLPAEQVVGAGMVLSMVIVWGAQLISILQMTTAWPALGPHLPRAELAFTLAVAINGIAPAFPLSLALIRAARLDRDGRACRRLEPMWRDLTAAVPEIVLHPTGTPGTQVIRMSVEIRDALMQLAPYLPPGAGNGVRRMDYALAASARRAGAAPAAVPRSPFGAGDFDADLEQLMTLAREWSGKNGWQRWPVRD
ncbi:MAB_1171c family putative transporter [Nocardia sp. NPDC048505]|uniref:MAB_1171c family putative transporter n=1 Tax=unclassified Nocardia TaxID=2637762 RepID=UPI003405A14F